jgi:hypothetical protein
LIIVRLFPLKLNPVTAVKHSDGSIGHEFEWMAFSFIFCTVHTIWAVIKRKKYLKHTIQPKSKYRSPKRLLTQKESRRYGIME